MLNIQPKFLSDRAKALGIGVDVGDLTNYPPEQHEGALVYSSYEGFKTLYFSAGAGGWIPIIGADRFITTITYTVGSGGNFETLLEAFDVLQRFRPSFGSVLTGGGTALSRVNVILEIMSGVVIEEQIAIDSIDLGWIALQSEDAIVDVDVSGFLPRDAGNSHDNGSDIYPFLFVANSAACPRVETVFRAINKAPGRLYVGLDLQASVYEDWPRLDVNEPTPQYTGFRAFSNNIQFRGCPSCLFFYKEIMDCADGNLVVNGSNVTFVRSRVHGAGNGVSPRNTNAINIVGFRNAHVTLLGTLFQSTLGTNNDLPLYADLHILGGAWAYVDNNPVTFPAPKTYQAIGGTNIEPNTLVGFFYGHGYIAWTGYRYGGDNSGIDTESKIVTATVTPNVYTKAEVNALISGGTGLTIKEISATTYTLISSDTKKLLLFTASSAITVTCPTLSAGFDCVVRQKDAGEITFAPAVGVSILPAYGQGLTTLGTGAYVNVVYEAATEVGIKGDLIDA